MTNQSINSGKEMSEATKNLCALMTMAPHWLRTSSSDWVNKTDGT